MTIVATVALSTMVCNDLVIPVLLRIRRIQRRDLSSVLLSIRRGSIVLILILGYIYFRLIGESHTLVTIGLVSFAAAAQFAPAILIGIYWRGASRRGAISGLLAGFAVWAYTLLVPSFAISGWIPGSILEPGPFGIDFLAPYHLFGLTGFDHITHSVFWSMLANVGFLVGVSLFDRQGAMEQIQATLFVDVFRHDGAETRLWHGSATVAELKDLVARFIGPAEASKAFADFAADHASGHLPNAQADTNLVAFAERKLSGAIGASSARVMISSVVKGEALSIEGVMKILDETSQVIEYTHRLEEKSNELQIATTELKAANKRLEELDHLKDEFVSTVTHELRTPLTSIRAFSEILRDNPDIDPEERKNFLDITVKESERLTRLINQVLDLAKIESGTAEWTQSCVDLRDVIEDSLVSTRQLFLENSVHLTKESPHSPVFVRADHDRMVQVVINLMSNAVKFCESGTGEVVVRLSILKDEGRVEVADNGPGIPPEEQTHIFEKFHQLKGLYDEKPSGSGLGLAICQRIVEHHGGRIWVESEENKGTKFIFALTLCDPAGTG
jgi:signal transduction histidine kinase